MNVVVALSNNKSGTAARTSSHPTQRHVQVQQISPVLARGHHVIQQVTLVFADVSSFADQLLDVETHWSLLCQTVSYTFTRISDAQPASESFSVELPSILAWSTMLWMASAAGGGERTG